MEGRWRDVADGSAGGLVGGGVCVVVGGCGVRVWFVPPVHERRTVMKPPNHGMRVRLTPADGEYSGVAVFGYLALDPTSPRPRRGALVDETWWTLCLVNTRLGGPIPIESTDRIEVVR